MARMLLVVMSLWTVVVPARTTFANEFPVDSSSFRYGHQVIKTTETSLIQTMDR